MLSYVHWDGRAALPSLGLDGVPAKVLLVAELPVAPELRVRLTSALVRAGARYVCAWGKDSEAWHDAVDRAAEDLNRETEGSEAREYGAVYVRTTWHAREPLDEAMHFFKYTTSHPDMDLIRELIFHVSATNERERLILLHDTTRG